MIPASIPAQADKSSSESITERIRENYKCINCKEDVFKKECYCISRSLSLPNGDIDRLCESLLHIKDETEALRRVWVEKKDIEQVRKKIKKLTRNKKEQQPLICRGKEGNKHYRCYSCHEAKSACTFCNHCSCKKRSIQIPFSIWANDNMTWKEKEKYLKSKYIEAFSKQIGKQQNVKIIDGMNPNTDLSARHQNNQLHKDKVNELNDAVAQIQVLILQPSTLQIIIIEGSISHTDRFQLYHSMLYRTLFHRAFKTAK